VNKFKITLALIYLFSITLSTAVWAGAFIFAGEGREDLILHPSGYTGSGGVLNVGVCIDPNSLNAELLEIPVRNNISVWNDLQPIEGNLQAGESGKLDAESVLLHELGHCIGLAHVNAASESGLSENDYTKATKGPNGVFDVSLGADGRPGTHDDVRGDDVNLHWFNPDNDPFKLPIPTPVDTTQYKRDISNLPLGDNFAQNAGRDVAPTMNYGSSEAVMQQGSYYNETQRELVSDDAATVMLAASGVDERAGTPDDYQVVLTYEGITTGSNCDITVIMRNMSGLAYCSVGGGSIASNHWRISSAEIHLGAGYNYVFNAELRDSGGNQPPVASNDSGSVVEDGAVDIDVLGNDSDPENDPLDVTGVSNPPHGVALINGDKTIRYSPDANYNGSDNFSYTISDGNGGSDTANVSVTVSPVNDFPVATNDDEVTTTQGKAVDIYVLDNDTDVDGDPLNVEAASNGSNGTVSNNNGYVTYQPNASFIGSDSFSYTAADGNGGTDNATVTVDVQETPPAQPDLAVADYNTVRGTLGRSYLSTHAADGVSESATEFHSGGNKNRRYDTLEHIWQFNLTGGNHKFNVVAQTDFPGDDLDTEFQFQWSTNPNGGWQNMMTVQGGGGSFDIGAGVSGTIYVRVIDNDSTEGNTQYSTISIDHMYFDGSAPPTDPPAPATNPDPADTATIVPVNATLNWTAGAGAESHDVYFGTASGGLELVSQGQAGTSYDPGPLATSTDYIWRIDEQNSVGTGSGNQWSFRTASSSSPSELRVESIVLGTANASKGRKNGQANVTVINEFGEPVAGATVTGTFTGSFSQQVFNTTGASGAATLTTSNNPQKKNISFVFCVDTITAPGLTYSVLTQECQSY
jgi:hypothetical protein